MCDTATSDDDSNDEVWEQFVTDMISSVKKHGYAILEQRKCDKCGKEFSFSHTFVESVACPHCGNRVASGIPIPQRPGDLSASHYEAALQGMQTLSKNNAKIFPPLTDEESGKLSQEQRILLCRWLARCQIEFVNVIAKSAQALADRELVTDSTQPPKEEMPDAAK